MLIRKKQVKCSDNLLLILELIKSSTYDLKKAVIEKDGFIGFLHKQKQETYEISTKKADSAKTKKDVSKKSEPAGVNKIYLI